MAILSGLHECRVAILVHRVNCRALLDQKLNYRLVALKRRTDQRGVAMFARRVHRRAPSDQQSPAPEDRERGQRRIEVLLESVREPDMSLRTNL